MLGSVVQHGDPWAEPYNISAVYKVKLVFLNEDTKALTLPQAGGGGLWYNHVVLYFRLWAQPTSPLSQDFVWVQNLFQFSHSHITFSDAFCLNIASGIWSQLWRAPTLSTMNSKTE